MSDVDALQLLAEHALPEGEPGAWIRDAIRLLLAESADDRNTGSGPLG